ncbi:MAG: sulfotransferase family protein [Deltaproteobacteria bacterium]|nr:sulfotransferase family protein [Deltaproteobacteria bacterium]
MSSEIVVVSGLPRSGTSLMMQILGSGGLPLAMDGVRAADEDNPIGYFELEAVKQLRAGQSGFLTDLCGKAVKIVSLLLRELPRGFSYRVIFMMRDLSEVLASQRAMLARRGVTDDIDDETMSTALRTELVRVADWCASREDVTLLYVPHDRLIRDSAREVARVNAFLGGALDEVSMSAAVRPELHRRRAPQR